MLWPLASGLCCRDWTNACSDGALTAYWADRQAMLAALMAHGLLTASADASLLAVSEHPLVSNSAGGASIADTAA